MAVSTACGSEVSSLLWISRILDINPFPTGNGTDAASLRLSPTANCVLPFHEWIVDQYQISTDKRSGITNDPNREDDPEYILRLIGQVVYVSLETVKIVKALTELGIASTSATSAN